MTANDESDESQAGIHFKTVLFNPFHVFIYQNSSVHLFQKEYQGIHFLVIDINGNYVF